MTSHAMTLPGIGRIAPPGATDCRGLDCYAVIGPAPDGDTRDAWHATFQGGAPAMDIYLAQYNAEFGARHGANCQFHDLPPSIHVACAGNYRALLDELEWANQARFGIAG